MMRKIKRMIKLLMISTRMPMLVMELILPMNTISDEFSRGDIFAGASFLHRVRILQ